MANAKTLPLIEKVVDGCFRLTARSMRYNSQNYPIVDLDRRDEVFKTEAAAKIFVRGHFGARPGEFVSK